MEKALESWESLENGDVADRWHSLRTTVYDTALKVLAKPEKKHQDWFSDQDTTRRTQLEERSSEKAKQFQFNTRSNRSRLAMAKRQLQKYTRKLKSDWWAKKAQELQQAADINDMKAFCNGLREVYGPKKRGAIQLKSEDRHAIFQEETELLDGFTERFDHPLNTPDDVDSNALNSITPRPIITSIE